MAEAQPPHQPDNRAHLQPAAVGGQDAHPGAEEAELPDMAIMDARLSKLEVALDGMRHAQNLTLGGVAGVGAAILAVGGVIVALMIYGFTRTDQLADRIAAVPGQIASENRDIVKTLSDAITATKQQMPQVVLLPQPQLPAPPPSVPEVRPTPAPAPVPTAGQLDLSKAKLVLTVTFKGEARELDEATEQRIGVIVERMTAKDRVVVASSAAEGRLGTARAIVVANAMISRGFRGTIELTTTTEQVRPSEIGIFYIV